MRALVCTHGHGRALLYMRACSKTSVHALVASYKKIEIWIPGVATNFQGFSTTVRAFCTPKLCNLAHTKSSIGHSLIYWIEYHSWNLTNIFNGLGS